MTEPGEVKLTQYELQILRECNGEFPISQWGAAVGACLEALRGFRLVNHAGKITELGKEYLKKMAEPTPIAQKSALTEQEKVLIQLIALEVIKIRHPNDQRPMWKALSEAFPPKFGVNGIKLDESKVAQSPPTTVKVKITENGEKEIARVRTFSEIINSLPYEEVQVLEKGLSDSRAMTDHEVWAGYVAFKSNDAYSGNRMTEIYLDTLKSMEGQDLKPWARLAVTAHRHLFKIPKKV